MLTSLLQIILDLDGQAAIQNIPNANAASYEIGFSLFVGGILRAIMVFCAIIVLIFLVWGSVDWISSAGEKGKLDSARNKMTNAVIGLIVLASVLAIYTFVQNFLGIQVFNFI